MLGDQPVIVLRDYADIPIIGFIIGLFLALFCGSSREEIRDFLRTADSNYSVLASQALLVEEPIENKTLKRLMRYSTRSNLLQERLTFKASGSDVDYYRTFRGSVISMKERVQSRCRDLSAWPPLLKRAYRMP